MKIKKPMVKHTAVAKLITDVDKGLLKKFKIKPCQVKLDKFRVLKFIIKSIQREKMKEKEHQAGTQAAKPKSKTFAENYYIRKAQNKYFHNKHRRARTLRPLTAGKEERRGKIIEKDKSPRSYIVATTQGTLRRNQRHLSPLHTPPRQSKASPKQDDSTHFTNRYQIPPRTLELRQPSPRAEQHAPQTHSPRAHSPHNPTSSTFQTPMATMVRKEDPSRPSKSVRTIRAPTRLNL